MSARIILGASNTNASKLLLQFVSSQEEALQQGRRIKAILDKAQYGAPADWQAVATELGLTGAGALQQAQDAWTIVATALTAIDVGAVAELARLDQG